MSGGLNKEFRKAMGGEFGGPATPLAYLRSHRFASRNDPSMDALLKAGIYRVNLVRAGIDISLCLAAAARSRHSHAFEAYWLPFTPTAARTLELSDDVDYFFTPSLTGCIFEIDLPVVTHHGGQMEPWPPPALEDVPDSAGWGHRKWHNHDFYACIVIGVRTRGAWRFYQQSYDTNDVRALPAEQVSEI
jgi:hypothetical protein